MPLIKHSDHIYYEFSSMFLFVPVEIGAGATAAIVVICVFLMVCITGAALFIYKKYYQRDTAVVHISKQPDMQRNKPNNLSSSTKITSSQLIVGGDEKKRKRKKKHESTNRTSPSIVLQQIQ